MIRAGELAGSLDVVLERLASLLEHERALRKKIMSSLAYPSVVLAAATVIVTFLLATVVPMFATTYAQMHVPLPAVTSALMNVSALFQTPAFWLVPALCGFCCLFIFGRESVRGRKADAIDRLRLRLPVLGSIVRKTILARLSRALGTMLAAGVALTSALELAEGVVQNCVYRESIASVRAGIHDGFALSERLDERKLYDPMFRQLIFVGEETGTLDSMFFRIADFYDVDVDAALTALTGLIEPFLIICLGGAVAFIVAAIFLPLYTLIGSIK